MKGFKKYLVGAGVTIGIIFLIKFANSKSGGKFNTLANNI